MVITGMVPFDLIDPETALATAFRDVGQGGFATLVAAGAVAGLTTVVMTLLIGAVRVLFAMSRDGLLPHGFGRTNRRTGTPIRITLTIGTLTAFRLVSVAVPVLRRTRADDDNKESPQSTWPGCSACRSAPGCPSSPGSSACT